MSEKRRLSTIRRRPKIKKVVEEDGPPGNDLVSLLQEGVLHLQNMPNREYTHLRRARREDLIQRS